MFRCLFCGLENPSEKARFCVECGPDSPSIAWASEEIDQPAKVTQYFSLLSEFYYDTQNSSMIEKFSRRIREKLKISFNTHTSICLKLDKQKKSIGHLAKFRFEFNENVTDAYANHDTFIKFRYTNLSEDDLFKITLIWNDPDNVVKSNLKSELKSLVKPMTSTEIGLSIVFERIGVKEISDLQIIITDQFGESANFRIEPFSFNVGNHDSKIIQNISTHNQISIEGRGVVDASGMGTDKGFTLPVSNTHPIWKELNFSFILPATTHQENSTLIEAKVAVTQPMSKMDEISEVDYVKGIKYARNDLLSVLKAVLLRKSLS
jgi:hypothetical protein